MNKNYFDEEKARTLLKEYQKTTIFRDNAAVIKDVVLEREIVNEITKIVNAIIMVYRYYIFEDYDDLKQHALHACYTNFMKFNPEISTAFNYFSIIAKISLLNYTDRRKKHRNHQDIADQLDLEGKHYIEFDSFIEELDNTLFNIINENFIGNKRKKYVKISSILIRYLKVTKKFVSKSDMYSYARCFGIKNTEIREFVKTMSSHNDEIFGLLT